jgi:hypothetical protein
VAGGVLVLLSLLLGRYWPWLVPGPNGYVRSWNERVTTDRRRQDTVTTWRARDGRLLIRMVGFHEQTFFVDPERGAARWFEMKDVFALGPWLITTQVSEYPWGRLPYRNELVVTETMLTIGTPDGRLFVRR